MKYNGTLALLILITSTIVVLWMSKAFRKEEGISFNKKEEEEKRRQRKEKKAAFSEERLRYEFEMLKDPKTGKIPKGIFEKELLLARTLPEKRRTFINGNTSLLKIAAVNNYIPAGPNNIGGRTRALLYDRRYNGSTNRVIIAGCVSGGIMRSANGGNNWVKVTPEGDIHNFTAIAQDTRPGFEDTWYAGGGESYGNTASELGAAYLGFGLWKSTNNGASWTKLPMNNVTEFDGRIIPAGTLEEFDHPFDYVHRIAINPVNGHVYVAGHRRLLQSTDGGASFQTVFGSNTAASPTTGQMDISISNTGRVFLAVNGGNPDAGLRGVWVSPTGNRNSFSRIAGGSTLGIDSVSNWRGNAFDGDSKRILLTLAPSNQNLAYVFYENGLSNGAPAFLPEADLFRLDIAPTIFTWSNRSANMPNFPGDDLIGSDPLAVQNGYDMLVAVKPDDPNIVFVGGTNLYRSSDGFATANNTAWINGYNTSFTYQTYPNGHADIHSLAFNPSANNEAICGDDGGIRGTSNISAGAVSWNPLPNYQTLQYYYVAIDPDAGKNNFAGGAQDNGTLLRDKARVLGTAAADSNNHVRLSGGDGSATGISRRNASNNTQYVYGGSQFGTIRRIRIAPSLTTSVDIRPNNLTTANQNSNEEFGEFVTNFRLNPDNTEDLYYVNFNRLFRTTAASSVTRDSWTELTGIAQAVNPANPASGRNISIRAIAFSRGAYAPSHCLFLGSTQGRIFRLNDPRNASASSSPADITPAGMQGNVQDIAVNPEDDNEIMAVISNYNTVSIWWTANAKAATPVWYNAEGNLSLPSIRSCAIVSRLDTANNPAMEYYVGTSIGLYSTENLKNLFTKGGSPVWEREGSTVLNFAVVQSLAHRPADNVLLAGTHGNGMYYTFMQSGRSNPVPVENIFIKRVAPTLTTGIVQYQTGNFSVKKIVVGLFNMQGQLLLRQENEYADGSINLGQFASGMYLLSIMSDDGKHKFTQKIMKM